MRHACFCEIFQCLVVCTAWGAQLPLQNIFMPDSIGFRCPSLRIVPTKCFLMHAHSTRGLRKEELRGKGKEERKVLMSSMSLACVADGLYRDLVRLQRMLRCL